jgi:hypothetical protein
MYVTWAANDVNGKKVALQVATEGYAAAAESLRAKASTAYRNISTPNVSVREGFNRSDYDWFRPGEELPTDDHGIQAAGLSAYHRFPIVRNVVDMMVDFVVKGLDVAHPSPRVEKLGREWFAKVKGRSVSRKITRMGVRTAAAPVRRHTRKLPDATMDVLRSVGGAGSSPLPPGEIPLGYTVLNPVHVDVVGGELAQFVGERALRYSLRLPESLTRRLRNPRTAADRAALKGVPPALLKAIADGERSVLLPENKTVVLHYHKDDHEEWGKSLLYPLLDDLQMLTKLKMADRSALDAAISHIRLWQLGDLKERIFPTAEAVQRLADMLLHNVGGGCMDLIWGPDLRLIETNTEVSKFLGIEKYVPTLSSIYQGLGVPPALTGAFSDTGMTNNFVSLRVLVERLEYLRQVLVEFWLGELAILQSVFGFRQPFKLRFDVPNLSDDSAERRLLIEMVDRDIISPDFLQERFGADPELELARIRRNARQRREGSVPPKAGPFHDDSKQEAHLTRLVAGSGEHAPSELGVHLKPRKPGEEPPAEKAARRKKAELAARKPAGPNGRPPGARDSVRRDRKRVAPKQSAAAYARALLWAEDAQKAVEELVKPPFLASRGKATLRQLTAEESDAFERLKFRALCLHEVGSEVTEGSVRAALASPAGIPQPIEQLYRATAARFREERGAEPTAEQARQLQSMVCALYGCELV